MRAVVADRPGPPDVLRVVDRPEPAPGAGEVAKVGEHVDPAWLGRRVVSATGGRGGYAERGGRGRR